jgi:hypothetical protein
VGKERADGRNHEAGRRIRELRLEGHASLYQLGKYPESIWDIKIAALEH